ncbi:MAG TPA: hypothetical protein VKV32_03870, partial [Stellaceae bacterium]|nr:hypothetical protein [Stellaceae bacterium]
YLMLFNVWRFPVSLRRWVIAFGVLTLFSAIEIGLHWFTDIVIALPYTVATMALVNPDLATNKLVRFKVAGVGYGLTLFWMIGIRENWMGISADSAIEWALIGLTIFVSLMLLRQHDMALGKAATPYRPARRVAAALGH